MAKLIRKLPVFDLELFERFKLADIEISSSDARLFLLA
jgi:hypothetical protein